MALVTKGYTGVRWGELVGLEAEYVRPGSIRIEWQLYELDTGELVRCPPKDGSYRTIDIPEWHSALLARHLLNARPVRCRCHDRLYVFRGFSAANGAVRQAGAKVVDVARRAGVSTGTVSAVLNRPETVPDPTRAKVELAIADLGYLRNSAHGELAPHWRRSGFNTWLFRPAVSGWYPAKAPQPARPVPIKGCLWPGIPVRGRAAGSRADACWQPIESALTPHGLRHTHKTILD